MNVAGPSRQVPVPSGRLAPGGRVESTYEQHLLELLNQLSLDEMDEIQTFFTRRTGAGEPLSDHDIAMNDLLQQARALADFNEDRMLAQRIAAGEDVGVELQRPTVQTPRVAVPQPNGHGTAAQRNENQQPARRNATATAPSQTWGGWLSSVVCWAFSSEPASEPGPTNTSTAAPRIPVVKRPTGHDCVICQDPIYGAEIRASCGHYYDVGCITDLFQSATRDETLYPPRCCRQNIPFPQVRPHLSQTLIATFQEKQSEFSTLKRIYCSSPTCSRFLGPLSEGIFATKVYTCPAPSCGRRTCGRCREQHPGDWTHVCRPDADAAQVLELSRASGWARCPGCSQMIELNIGCFHMTCRCRTEFCYLCRERWKTCSCVQWDERLLLAAAEERVDAQLGVRRERGVRHDAPAQQAPPAPAPVAAAARNPFAILDQQLADSVQAVPARRPAPAPAAATTRPVVRLQTASSSNGRTANTAATPAISTRTLADIFTFASASTSTSDEAYWPELVPNLDGIRERMILEMMERLRIDHDCDHIRWRYEDDGGYCDSCGDYLPLYLFRCQDCEMLACNQCRRNRL